MAEYRQIHTRIWKDSWFLELPSKKKLLFIYLFSNERACLAGLYDLSPKIMAFEADLELDFVLNALGDFEADGKIRRDGNLLWIPNLLRYNANNLASPKIQTHLHNTIALFPECRLKQEWIANYNALVEPAYRMDTATISRPESESEQEQEPEPEHESEQEHEQEDIAIRVTSKCEANYLEIRQFWIDQFPEKPKPREDNATLRGKASTRMRSDHFQENWRVALIRASKSAFLAESGWFTLSWFLKNDDHYEKCLNGNYDNQTTQGHGKSGPLNPMEEYAKLAAEEGWDDDDP